MDVASGKSCKEQKHILFKITDRVGKTGETRVVTIDSTSVSTLGLSVKLITQHPFRKPHAKATVVVFPPYWRRIEYDFDLQPYLEPVVKPAAGAA